MDCEYNEDGENVMQQFAELMCVIRNPMQFA